MGSRGGRILLSFHRMGGAPTSVGCCNHHSEKLSGASPPPASKSSSISSTSSATSSPSESTASVDGLGVGTPLIARDIHEGASAVCRTSVCRSLVLRAVPE
eukprot:4976069-Prymnesium_polylepis.1